MTRHLYFAYGSNLDPEAMAQRCPDSEPVGRAVLDGWTLTFRGVADIEPRDGGRTEGAVWRISSRDLERLDLYEGYPSFYRRELRRVRVEDGKLEAIVYVMNDDYVGLPSTPYYRTIERGYRDWGLPLAALEAALLAATGRLRDLGVQRFEPDGPKRMRPAG